MYEVAKFAVGTLKLIYFACLKAKAAYKKRFGGSNIIFCEVLMYKFICRDMQKRKSECACRKKHMACCKKHKAHILKYKALILK